MQSLQTTRCSEKILLDPTLSREGKIEQYQHHIAIIPPIIPTNPQRTMSVIGVTTDDVCAGLDEFEASTLRKSDWWYESQAEHLSVWNSTTSLANNSTENQNESLWQAFCNRGIRVILDMHVRDPENFQKVSNFVKDQTAQDFREDWSTLAS